MRPDVSLTEHLRGLHAALPHFVDHASRAGLDAQVLTTPGWTTRQLIAHQGMVHRWSSANVRGEPSDPTAFEAEGLAVDDPLTWLHDGAVDVVNAIEAAPEDLTALVFLHDPPPPRQFWARRQCHETTIHAVDALSASLGRTPRAEDTWISREIAVDGIDELLTGFAPRQRFRLRSGAPTRFAVRPTDSDASWLVRVSDQPVVTERNCDEDAEVVLEAPATALYLALWNRSFEVESDGLDLWRATARITWA